MVSRRGLLGASAGLMSLGMLNPALARTPYPERLIRIVVGNAAGGTDDAISRSVAHEIAGQFGQSVIIENRGGGSTTIAGSMVASAAPDGYTILCLISAGIVQTVLRDKLKYGLSSFAPIVGVGGFPLALAVSATSKARLNSIQDLIAVAKSPEGVTFASGGVGTVAHLTSVMFLNTVHGKGVDVAYKNNPEGLQALAGGFTQMMFASASEVAALRSEGKLRVLAVTSNQRAANLPDVPTMRELGFPGINSTLWHGFVAPAGTPADIVGKLAEAITRSVNAPAFQNRFKPLAFQEELKSGAALNSYINAEASRWRTVITENKIQSPV
ncbi:tripartite tricarboxylate transporter substrate binding protein [Cupriavidus sp. P-10]|uniref:Bug family tripartite tricarboxylate transporter substrate binding protein n=1 Tax=Cupriavidus sp. P-10 TaxID=2027911 RepID=UPI000E2F8413|nr:tripartite tricarboxylate transporter substrate binding protein [Cupriavidus sp. P-10]BDB27849.1 tripartite tricarboxylate transporter substrate binding protein [Cupriavidus sp. P-10]